jgi:ATP adenylyltransferase
MTMERLWAGWRSSYVSDATATGDHEECFLCTVRGLDEGAAGVEIVAPSTLVLERTSTTLTVMNLYPYGSGHLLIAPTRHEPDLDGLDDDEAIEVMLAIRRGVRAVRAAYSCDGVNVGFNLGRAAGAGIPGHLHAHVLPRWTGDTNFMTAIAETRVLPESLAEGWQKLHAVWPVR